MPLSLADGRTKFTILTTEPDDPESPTITELNNGLQADPYILKSDFTWGATDSDKVAEPPLSAENNQNALAASNFAAGVTAFRYHDAAGVSEADFDDVFQALKAKGTNLWCYARRTSKKASAAWAAGDEIFLGGHVITDEPQPPSQQGGYVKYRIPLEMQEAYPWTAAAAAA